MDHDRPGLTIGHVLRHKGGNMPTPKKKWMGTTPTHCDLCRRTLTQQFVDGRLRSGGQWAIMCPTCHRTLGVGLGTGYGQRYDLKTLEKVEG